jgi:hypothetical protein
MAVMAAVYTITIRSAEYALPPDVMDDIVSRFLSGGEQREERRGGRRREVGEDDEGREDE